MFKTKKALTDYTRDLIAQLGCCEIKEGISFQFFNDLLKLHDEYDMKVGAGILGFRIGLNPTTFTPNHMSVMRVDGTEESFSWKHCCQQRPRTPKENLTNAMREAIDYQAVAFKLSNKLKCVTCGSTHKLEADHINNFSILRDNFLKNRDAPLLLKDLKTSKTILAESQFKNDWIDYHEKEAKFQILCKPCNAVKR